MPVLPKIPIVSSGIDPSVRRALNAVRNLADVLPAYIDAKAKVAVSAPVKKKRRWDGKVSARSVTLNKFNVKKIIGPSGNYIDLDSLTPEFIHTRSGASPNFGVDVYDTGGFIFGDTTKVGIYMEGTAAGGLILDGGAISTGRIQGIGSSAYLDLTNTNPEFLLSYGGAYAARINKDGSFLFGNQAKTVGTPYMEGTAAGFIMSGAALTVGKIQGNGGAYIDLDSATTFIKSNGVDIQHSGLFTFGNPAGNNVNYDGTNINIMGGFLSGGGHVQTSGTAPSSVLIDGVWYTASVIGEVTTASCGVIGNNTAAGGFGVGASSSGAGGVGVFSFGTGVGGQGNSNAGTGIVGKSISGIGTLGISTSSHGIYGQTTSGYSGWFTGGLGVYCVGNIQATGTATLAGVSCSGTLQATGAGRIVLNPITISDGINMVNKVMWVDGSGLVHAT